VLASWGIVHSTSVAFLSSIYRPPQPIGCGATSVIVLLSASVVKLTRLEASIQQQLWRSLVHVTSGAEVRSSQEKPAFTSFSIAEAKGMPGETVRETTERNRSLSFAPMPGQPATITELSPMSVAAKPV
jgi:hypothetical protein